MEQIDTDNLRASHSKKIMICRAFPNIIFYLAASNNLSAGDIKNTTMTVTRTFDLLGRYMELYPKDDALCFRQNGVWTKFSTTQYIEYSHNF